MIPERFYKGNDQPQARTVGEMKTLLDELPDSLPLCCGFQGACQLVVYNVSTGSPFLSFQELDEDDADTLEAYDENFDGDSRGLP